MAMATEQRMEQRKVESSKKTVTKADIPTPQQQQQQQ